MTVVVAVGGFITYQMTRPEIGPVTPVPVVQGTAVEAPAADPVVAEVAPPVEDAAPQTLPPQFDVVRVDAEGNALVAGKGSDLVEIGILIDGTQAAVAQTDGAGKFVALFEVAPSDTPQIVTLVMTMADGGKIGSDESIILQPRPVVGATQPVVASADPSASGVARPASSADVAVAGVAVAPDTDGAADVLAEAEPWTDDGTVVTTTPLDPQVQTDVADVSEVDGEPVIVAALTPEAPVTPPTSAPKVAVEAAPLTTAEAVVGEAREPAVREEVTVSDVTQAAEAEVKTVEVDAAGAEAEVVAAVEPAAVEPEAAQVEPVAAVEPIAPEAPSTTVSDEVVVAEQDDVAAPEVQNPEVAEVAAPEAEDTGLAPEIEVAALPEPVEDSLQVTVPLAEPVTDPVQESAAVETVTVETQPVSTQTPVTVAEAKPQAPKVLKATDQGIEILQAPELIDEVVIDTIAYEVEGEVKLAGRGAGDEFVRVYLNNKPVKTTQITPDGSWEANLPDIDTGIYTLRVDQVDDAGTVVARVETPFKREDEAVIQAAAEKVAKAETATGVGLGVVTVQPGFTLWAIAREKYGEGPLYVRVFDANRDQIKDPDLIYPGQVFSIPEG